MKDERLLAMEEQSNRVMEAIVHAVYCNSQVDKQVRRLEAMGVVTRISLKVLFAELGLIAKKKKPVGELVLTKKDKRFLQELNKAFAKKRHTATPPFVEVE